MTGRNILIALAIYHDGNWRKIYNSIKDVELLSRLDYKNLLSKLKSNAITILDPEYPSYLKQIKMPPFVLFYKGDISLIYENKNHLAVIGSREVEEEYATATRNLVNNINKDIVVVSGVAKGVDAIAHDSALKSGKKTIGVIGSGLDVVYPIENEELYEKIARDGLLISEYPHGSPPEMYHFPFRNRLIAAFSNATLVTQASIKSGTMITATFTLEQNKNVMCLPSNKFNESGCNLLIKEGAFLVENEEEIEYFLR